MNVVIFFSNPIVVFLNTNLNILWMTNTMVCMFNEINPQFIAIRMAGLVSAHRLNLYWFRVTFFRHSQPMSNPVDKSLSVGKSATLTETNVKQGFRACIWNWDIIYWQFWNCNRLYLITCQQYFLFLYYLREIHPSEIHQKCHISKPIN